MDAKIKTVDINKKLVEGKVTPDELLWYERGWNAALTHGKQNRDNSRFSMCIVEHEWNRKAHIDNLEYRKGWHKYVEFVKRIELVKVLSMITGVTLLLVIALILLWK